MRRIRGLCLLVLACLLLVRPAPGQGRDGGLWASHTVLRSIQDLTASDDALWAATTGGVFSYDPATFEFRRFTAVEGLHSIETQAIAYDAPCGCVWIGYQDGVLDRLEVGTGEVRTFRDIERAAQFPDRNVYRLVVRGDSLLVATGFGVVVFDTERQEVRDTYSRLGTLPPTTPVRSLTVAPTPAGPLGLWLGTDGGVAYAPLSTPNLQDPQAWTVEQVGAGAGEQVWAVAAFNGALYAGTGADLYVREGEAAYRPLGLSSDAVTDLYVVQGIMVGVERFRIVAVDTGGRARSFSGGGVFQDPTRVVPGFDGGFWVGDAQRGLVSIERPDLDTGTLSIRGEPVFPSGPFHGQFSDLTFDERGNLWAGGVAGAGTGFYRFDAEGNWTNYTGQFFSALQGRARFTSIHTDGAGNTWSGSEGSGVAQVTPEGEVAVYDRNNSSLLPASGTSDFIIVGGVATDADGNLWSSTRGSSRPLHLRSPEGAWTALPPLTGQGLNLGSTAYGRLFVDSFDQKWIIVHDEFDFGRKRGLAVLDAGNDPTDPADDAFQFFDERGGAGEGLPAIGVNVVTEDRDGLIWIGTDSGLAFMINTGIVANDPSAIWLWPFWADRSQGTFALFGLRVNDIAVDPANRLWVATNEGAWLLQVVEGGGYETVEHFTTDNSPLFSDEVVSVAVDEANGRVYFATSTGLVSYQGDAVRPVTRVQDLFIYPNPVRVQGGEAPTIYIEGLVEETELRILAPHGGLVARLSARGGRVRWDGRDLDDNLVASGVYLVVAVGQDGEGTAYGKVAVIR